MAMGLTPRMKDALGAIVNNVAEHGAMPSRTKLASDLSINKTGAARLIVGLVRRGAVIPDPETGQLAGFGGAGVAVMLPVDVAMMVAQFCRLRDEQFMAVVVDAISLHIDQCGETA